MAGRRVTSPWTDPMPQIPWFENLITSCIVATLTIYKSKKVNKSLWVGYRISLDYISHSLYCLLGACLKMPIHGPCPDLLNQNIWDRAQEFVLTNSWWFLYISLNMKDFLSQLCLMLIEEWGHFLPNSAGLSRVVLFLAGIKFKVLKVSVSNLKTKYSLHYFVKYLLGIRRYPRKRWQI